MFRARLSEFKVFQVESSSLFGQLSADLKRGFEVALDRALLRIDKIPFATRSWIEEELRSLATAEASDQTRSRVAEVEAALRLSWLGPVERVKAVERRRGIRRPDLRVEGINIEVYCPQEHTLEKQVAQADLRRQLEAQAGSVRVAVTVSYPATGSGRRVCEDGTIRRDPANRALMYPANKLIDRILTEKRSGGQFPDKEMNILWLDLKHGLGLSSVDCMPFRSVIAKGTCFTGTSGVWHGFFAEEGSPLLADRTALEWPVGRPTYGQQKCGWFRELPKVSAAILSTRDGLVFFENPWASAPLGDTERQKLFRLSELRPELSWSNESGTLRHDVAIMLAKISWLARLACSEQGSSDLDSDSGADVAPDGA